MGYLGAAALASNKLQIGGSALSLVGATTALVFGDDLPPGISGFLFDIPINEHVRLSAQITDHYTEGNSFIQDHCAIEPVRITLVGLVSELVYSKSAIETYLQQVLDRLAPLDVLSPEQSTTAKKYLSEASRLKSAVTSAVGQLSSFASIFDGDFGKSYQQKAYAELESLFNSRATLTVETPWKTFSNMMIETLEFEQDDSTKDITTVTATFKEVRFVSTTSGVGQLLGRINSQKSETANKGVSKGKSVAASAVDLFSGN